MRGRLVGLYVAVAYGLAMVIGAAMWAFGESFGAAAPIVFGVPTMAAPLVATVVVQRVSGERALTGIGGQPRTSRWLGVAMLAPVALALLTTAIGLLLPGVAYDPEMTGVFSRLAAVLPPEQIEEARREIAAMPVHPFWLTLPQALVAGATINALAAFGEEVGWRGWLYRELRPLGFWTSNALIGTLWGAWHAPLILQGHNYPDHPVVGAFLFVPICVLLSPLHAWLRERTGTVWGAAVCHGTFNAAAGLPYLVSAGSDLLVGAPGLAGAIALLATNVGIWMLYRPPARSGADG